MANRIHLASPHMSDEGYEQAFVKEAFDTNWVAPAGPHIEKFEDELAEMVGTKHAVALNSGTSAIHLALKDIGVGEGDIVFAQSLTFSATVNPILYENATPVFIDSEPGTWNMDPKKLEEAFEKYSPKAVLVVHLYGLSAKIDEIRDICKKHGVPLVEDAAESLGTIYKDQWTGTFGDYGIFSFNGNKIITSSGGGMLVSDNKEAIDKARYWATQARQPVRHYEHTDLGYNYRLSNVSAGIGRGQLRVLEERVQQKRHIFDRYKEGLSDIQDISFISEQEGERANYWLSAMIIDEASPITPTMVLDALENENIEGRPIWKPMHMQPVFEEYDVVGGKVSEFLFDRGLCLPSDTKMTDDDLDRIIQIIRTLWDK